MDYKNPFDYDGKVTLITGAGGSIGRELAIAFAECGSSVVAVGRTYETLSETVSLLKKTQNQEHLAVTCDISSTNEIRDLVTSVYRKYGRVDHLLNHAGMNIRKPSLDFTEKDWERVESINLKGHFFLAQAVGKIMIEQGGGRIVSTASVSSKRGHKNLAIYAATKGGVSQLVKVLAHEWALNGVTVNAIAPGYVRTNQTKSLLEDKERYSKMVELIPMKRFGELHEIAGVALFLCSDLASYITGQVLYIDGGRTID